MSAKSLPRMAVSLSVALAGGLLVSGGLVAVAAHGGTRHVIPWASKPAAAAPNVVSPTAPACTTARLKAALSRHDLFMGHTPVRQLTVRNVSERPCALSSAIGGFAAGHRGGARVRVVPIDSGQAVMLVLAGGQDATAEIVRKTCPVVTARDGGQYSVVTSAGYLRLRSTADRFTCTTAQSTQLELAAAAPTATADATTLSTYGGLSASLSLPDAVTPGEQMDYVVALTNTTDAPIAMDPCPAYTEAVGPGGASERDYLNCAGNPVIAAGQTAYYSMVMQVPAGAGGGGFLKVLWALDEGPNAGAGVPLS
jgi:hypothetical protein